jgi:hypothetical protein
MMSPIDYAPIGVDRDVRKNRSASALAQMLCVETERPVTRPVSARMKAPEHTETNLAPRPCWRRSQDTTPGGTSGFGRFTIVGGMIKIREQKRLARPGKAQSQFRWGLWGWSFVPSG